MGWYAVSDMDSVNFAAQVFLGAVLGKVILSLWEGRKKRIEELAVHYEFEDEKTNPERKGQLLMRYPQYLVEAPSRDYWSMAHEQLSAEKKSRKNERPRFVDYLLGLVFLALSGIVGFGCLALGMSWFNHEGAGMAAEDASLTICSYSADHVWMVIFGLCVGWYFAAVLAKIITDD